MHATYKHWQQQQLLVLHVWAQTTLTTVCIDHAAAAAAAAAAPMYRIDV